MTRPHRSMLLLVPLLVGCSDSIQGITFTPGTIGTVVTAEWLSDASGTGVVTYNVGGIDREAPATVVDNKDGTYAYTATLLGLRSDSSYEASVEIRYDDGGDPLAVSESFSSGPLGSALPGLTVDGESSLPEGYILTALAQDPAIACIIDAQGSYVWAFEEETEGRVLAEVHPDPTGSNIIFASTEQDQTDLEVDAELIWVSLDGDTVERVSVPEMHHDFLVHDDGTIAYIAYDTREVDGRSWRGDEIIELYADGTTSVIWNSWDDIPFKKIEGRGPDWTHANAINYDADEDAYYLSSYEYGSIYKIDRQTGELLWQFGGPWSDFDIETSAALANQHQFQLLDGGLLVFNNRPRQEEDSVLQEYAIDEAAGTAEEVWSYRPGLFSIALGDVERLETGNTLGTFSTAGVIDEVTPDGERVWRMEGAFGTVFGYSNHLTDLQTLVH